MKYKKYNKMVLEIEKSKHLKSKQEKASARTLRKAKPSSMSLSKHRICGKNNRNPTNNMQICREMEQEQRRQKELEERKKTKMFSSIKDLFNK
jgi:hypothetical protein